MPYQVTDAGGMTYRLSPREQGLIEFYDKGSDRWCSHTITSDARELTIHQGCLAYKNKKGDVYFETATGWHQVTVEKHSSKDDYVSYDKPKKKGCLSRILWSPFTLIWWIIKQLFHLCTLGFFK